MNVEPLAEEDVRIVPANEASWSDVRDIFGTADAGRCQCQRFKVVGWIWPDSTLDERTAALRFRTQAPDTSGLTFHLAQATVGFARERDARALVVRIEFRSPTAGKPRAASSR